MPLPTNIKEEKSKEVTTTPLPPNGGNAIGAAEREDTQATRSITSSFEDQAAGVWERAKSILKETLDEGAFGLWIEPVKVLMIGKKLTLDCPDEYLQAYVERHYGDEIRDVLQGLGIQEFSFSSGIKKQAIQREKDQRQRRQRLEAGQHQTLANLPSKEQFKLLIGMFPCKENGFPGIRDWTDKLHWVWNVFQNMSRRGELPGIANLLKELETRKQSAEWRQAEGQYILSPDKWLAGKTTKRPWL